MLWTQPGTKPATGLCLLVVSSVCHHKLMDLFLLHCTGVAGDELHERAFWSSLTVKPPLYGADTPVSLFDEDVKFGWNLRKLGCLLSKYKVARVPGVTTPMTYFGMWKVPLIKFLCLSS